MSDILIRYKDVRIQQQDNDILEDVNLELNKGEFVYLIGKVGSGKFVISAVAVDMLQAFIAAF